MTAFPDFLLESGISLIIFYFFYLLILKKDTYYGRNRWFLLFSIVFSLVLPFIRIPVRPEAPEFIRSFALQEVVTSLSGKVAGRSFSLYPAILVYLSGVMFIFGILVFRILQIVHLIYRSPVENKGFYKLVRMPENRPAFSFFRWIFLPENTHPEDAGKIISHELIHIQNNHTADLLIMELLCVFQWFNPVAWLYKFTIKELHEYSVDDQVLSRGTGRLAYQNLILKQVFGFELFPIGNHFNKSLLKKRMIMMTKNKSPKISHVKLLAILPISIALIFFLSCSKTDKGNPNEPSIEKNTTSTVNEEPATSEEQIFNIVEEMPKFEGKSEEAFRIYLVKHLRYPETAVKDSISGRVFVNFVVEKDGSVSNVKVVRGVDPLLDAEAIRAVKASPNWTPGKQRGQAVRVSFTFPINFVFK